MDQFKEKTEGLLKQLDGVIEDFIKKDAELERISVDQWLERNDIEFKDPSVRASWDAMTNRTNYLFEIQFRAIPKKSKPQSIEEMRWKLYKVYDLGDWTADVNSWDDAAIRKRYAYYVSTGQIKEQSV